ncbi:putative cystatin-B [Penaeus vannamei]|uniref:Putative cystatin-B n=1 Tax=Penaeus vannamei TaxID=6689 RepID=A0A3R7Q9F9_PENVA|nr:putative cystatin-B [Penaeus vannamei]
MAGHAAMVKLAKDDDGRRDIRREALLGGGPAALEAVKSELEEKLGKKLDRFQLVSYKTQVVAGTNYFAKMDIGGEELVHMRVYRNLQGEVSLHSHQHPKTREEDIEYF